MTIWNFTLLCRLRDFFKDEIGLCSYSLIIGQFHFLLWTPFFFINFSHVCQIYVAEVLIIHFYRYCPSKVFITIWVTKWGQIFGMGSGSTPSLNPYLCCTFSGSTPPLAPVPYMSYVRWWGVNSISGSIFVLYLLRFYSKSRCIPIYISP